MPGIDPKSEGSNGGTAHPAGSHPRTVSSSIPESFHGGKKSPPSTASPVMQSIEDNYASEFHRRLTNWINDFNASLDEEHEVGVRLVTFGQSITFRLDDIGYWNPSLISFHGLTEDGHPVELIQHVSQISILLMTLPRKDPTQPKKPIGYISEWKPEEEAPANAAEPKAESL